MIHKATEEQEPENAHTAPTRGKSKMPWKEENRKQKRHESYLRYRDKNIARTKVYYMSHKVHLNQLAVKRYQLKVQNDPKFREKRRGYSLKQGRALRSKIILIIQKQGSCEQCGFSDIRALQIHHSNGRKKNRPKNDYNSMQEIIDGKVPYEILCANCHMILHNPRGQNWLDMEVKKRLQCS